jgi:uncharacterized membrane protein
MQTHETIGRRWLRWWKHRWMSEHAAKLAVPTKMAERLSARVAASESRHTGQVVLCIEGALPNSDLWRIGRIASVESVVRERALIWFGKLRVWDTEHNNGVLIYLLLAEHNIEIIADRGIHRHVASDHWKNVIQQLGAHLHQADFETGLTQALEEVSALLVQHCPLAIGQAPANELCNRVVWA